MVDESLHCPPGVEQSHVAVVEDISVLIPRILVVPGLKCEWSVDEIQVEIAEAESVQTCLECRFDALGPVIGVPQLCGNKNGLTRKSASRKPFLQRLADLALVSISLRGIEVSKSSFQCIFRRTYRHGWIGN